MDASLPRKKGRYGNGGGGGSGGSAGKVARGENTVGAGVGEVARGIGKHSTRVMPVAKTPTFESSM